MSQEGSRVFLSDKNIRMLWEVILDEDVVINKNREEITLINEIFLKVAQQFYDKEKTIHTDLISMNKKFISIIITILNQNFPKPKQIAIHENISPVLITAEEIQASRVNEFERNLSERQNDFAKSMELPLPETPNFSDDMKDEPITELDAIIKKTIAERNLEMQKITNNYKKEDVNGWIQSTETSLRVEKTREKELAMKTIKIQNFDMPQSMKQSVKQSVLDLNLELEPEPELETKTKHISWSENVEEIKPIPGLKFKITETNNDTHNFSLEAKIDNLEKKVDVMYTMIEKLLSIAKA